MTWLFEKGKVNIKPQSVTTCRQITFPVSVQNDLFHRFNCMQMLCFGLRKVILCHISAHTGSHLAPSLAGCPAAATKTTLSCLISCQEHKTHFSKGLHVTFSSFSSSSKERFLKILLILSYMLSSWCS